MKCEADLRVFPVSDSGADVIGTFEKIFGMNQEKITVHRSSDIKDVGYLDGKYRLSSTESEIVADFVVITTGGNAYAHTGSSGDGYGFARRLGHTVTRLGPSLSSFETLENFPKEISGISLPKARLKWNAETFTDGPLLFTHFGISGPAPFAFSSLLAFETIDAERPLKISLSPLAGWQMPDWDSYMEKEAKIHGNREVRNLLDPLPRRLVDALGTAGILPNRILNLKGATLSREDRKTLSKILGE
jgi:predicted Rossmann fold flavoprotein